MSAHSAGPWSIDADGCIFADGVCIGSIVPTNRATNGALIVAAPDMYEALRELVDDVCDRVDLDSPSCNPGIKTAVKFARAALAKAVAK